MPNRGGGISKKKTEKKCFGVLGWTAALGEKAQKRQATKHNHRELQGAHPPAKTKKVSWGSEKRRKIVKGAGKKLEPAYNLPGAKKIYKWGLGVCDSGKDRERQLPMGKKQGTYGSSPKGAHSQPPKGKHGESRALHFKLAQKQGDHDQGSQLETWHLVSLGTTRGKPVPITGHIKLGGKREQQVPPQVPKNLHPLKRKEKTTEKSKQSPIPKEKEKERERNMPKEPFWKCENCNQRGCKPSKQFKKHGGTWWRPG